MSKSKRQKEKERLALLERLQLWEEFLSVNEVYEVRRPIVVSRDPKPVRK